MAVFESLCLERLCLCWPQKRDLFPEFCSRAFLALPTKTGLDFEVVFGLWRLVKAANHASVYNECDQVWCQVQQKVKTGHACTVG